MHGAVPNLLGITVHVSGTSAWARLVSMSGMPRSENPFDVRHLLGRDFVAFGAGQFAERIFRDIILGGSKSTCDNDDICVVQAVAEFGKDSLPVVSDGGHVADLDTEEVEFTSNIRGVRIDNLTDENLIADGTDRSSFHLFSRYLTIL